MSISSELVQRAFTTPGDRFHLFSNGSDPKALNELRPVL
jgi:hypothetical protein